MTQLEVFSSLMLIVGFTLLLSLVRWFGRQPVVDRIRPYSPGSYGAGAKHGILSVGSFRDVIAPLASGLGASVAKGFGISEDLDRKLRRIQSPLNASQFRTRQLGWVTTALTLSVFVSIALRFGAALTLVASLGVPLLTFLIMEQRIVAASEAHQERLFHELPVVAEQLGMLLAAGYSLGAALHRVSARGSGVVSSHLQTVMSRTRQGLSETQALAEWAELADVPALDRLVSVLALNHEASDLGSLISDEARAIRREAHRQLIESIERKDQQVWIPVAIAALIPGTILIAIPFIQAMRTFSSA